METTREDYLDALAAHYATVPSKVGFARKCRMHLPEGLEGMRILDVGCRNGKGVLKLASHAGEAGFVLGVDWLPEHIAGAWEYTRERGDRGKPSAPYDFRVGYPEALDEVAREAEFDAAFVNCSMNLFYDIPRAFAQIGRLLRPNGLLIVDGVFADGPRDADVVRRARAIDNSVQAALELDQFLSLLGKAGFDHIETDVVEQVAPTTGFTDETTVACVDAIETVAFHVCMIQARRNLP